MCSNVLQGSVVTQTLLGRLTMYLVPACCTCSIVGAYVILSGPKQWYPSFNCATTSANVGLHRL